MLTLRRKRSCRAQPAVVTGAMASKTVAILAMLVATMAFAVRAVAETRVHNGVEYFVPEGFESKRQGIEESMENATALADLMNEVEALERVHDGFVDAIGTPAGRADSVGILIMAYPVEPDDIGDEEYLDDVFASMERYIATAVAAGISDGSAEQTRTISIAETRGQYSRMDVANAYGVRGNNASFLIKTVGNWNFDLIIVGSRDLNTPEIDAIIDSVRFADR